MSGRLPQRGDYALTTKLASLGLSFLSKSGVVDIAQPIIDRLAAATEELVRLAIVDDQRLTLVAKAQGARSGLRYDPDMGIELRLSCSAAGHAWLMKLFPRKRALEAVTRQGFGEPRHFGPERAHNLQGFAQLWLVEREPIAGLQPAVRRLRPRNERSGGACPAQRRTGQPASW